MSTPPASSRLACRPRPRRRRRSGRPQTERSSTAHPRGCQVLASQTVTMATWGPRPHCNHRRSWRGRWFAPACPRLVPFGLRPTERSRSACAAASAGEAFGDPSAKSRTNWRRLSDQSAGDPVSIGWEPVRRSGPTGSTMTAGGPSADADMPRTATGPEPAPSFASRGAEASKQSHKPSLLPHMGQSIRRPPSPTSRCKSAFSIPSDLLRVA